MGKQHIRLVTHTALPLVLVGAGMASTAWSQTAPVPCQVTDLVTKAVTPCSSLWFLDNAGASIQKDVRLGTTQLGSVWVPLQPIWLLSVGKAGAAGSDVEKAGNATGEQGSVGGAGGGTTLQLSSGTVLSSWNTVSVESAGGTGGNGGDAKSWFAKATAGNGGNGGAGGDVSVNSAALIQTVGPGGMGLLARSVGGSGGRAGSALGPVAVSGLAGSGGDGGRASVTQAASGSVSTAGNAAWGVAATSTGGAGGQGAVSAGNAAITSWPAGNSYKGGDGGGAWADNSGRITTTGRDAYGLVAQSLGGDGGDGSATIGMGGSIGSPGQRGGNGGDALATNAAEGVIHTSGQGATGILASSMAGRGGAGGFASGLITAGGIGSGGSQGGKAQVINRGVVSTDGAFAEAILAESIGGRGGDGGSAIGVDTLGGSGGLGGNASSVLTYSTGTISTRGADSIGILAQSIGGDGGHGGGAYSGGVGLAVAVGGSGGAGGSGDKVYVKTGNLFGTDYDARVSTEGDRADAIKAQSIGGGGGSGGDAYAFSAGPKVSVSVAVGGSGGEGGAGGATQVLVAGRSSLSTAGSESVGVFAQSVGGGGGAGGVAVSGAVSDGGSVSVSVGGSGGGGGHGDRVDLTVSKGASVTTRGEQAQGLFAQSVGGGGGVAGSSIAVAASPKLSLSVAVGGSGGKGGYGGEVFLSNDGAINTSGHLSSGIQAESVGGGGGDAGTTVAAAVSLKGPPLPVAVGGKGGSGGYGGAVTVSNSGPVVTVGDLSRGLLAQSVGGGGGNGGFAGAFALSLDPFNQTGAASVAVGGKGGGGGYGGTVSVADSGTITTNGDKAEGLLAQSIGGGGGTGGGAISGTLTFHNPLSVSVGGSGGTGNNSGGAVTVKEAGTITTSGMQSIGLMAQSVGGGGGVGGYAISGSLSAQNEVNLAVAVGGQGGSGGHGGAVTVDALGSIFTSGLGAHGLVAQSVGKGGGTGGNAGTVTVDLGGEKSKIPTTLSVAVGGSGGDGGDAGAVSVTTAADHHIQTSGDGSVALKAQSVGGGGGDGGTAFSVGFSSTFEGSATPGGFKVAVGGGGGDGGVGGALAIKNLASLGTQGKDSAGIFAQSVGGGGGNGGMSIAGAITIGDGTKQAAVSIGGSGGKGQLGGAVKLVNANASIKTEGETSDAIFGQSLGGGGGDGRMAVAGALSQGDGNSQLSVAVGGQGGEGSAGGKVEISNSGVLATTGYKSRGVVAQSIGGGGGNGGAAVALDLATNDIGRNVNAAVAVGGVGGKGNVGGQVDVFNTGSVSTAGANSSAIYAQSVGGGGGDGGLAFTALLSRASSTTNSNARTVNVSAAVGGKGGEASHGGDVTVFHASNDIGLSTSGDGSNGIFAQSVGGGGGDGGSANTLSVLIGKWCGTLPKVWQCSGTDPAKNNLDYKAAVGGDGGGSGNGGNVFVGSSGSIVTSGMSAAGIFAQSVGGGGGVGGNASLSAPDLGPEWYDDPGLWLTLATLPKIGFGKANKMVPWKSFSLALGGSGGASGDGNAVEVSTTVSSAIRTQGVASYGIAAQSVGGGGGIAGNAAVGLTGWIGIGGAGGAAGDGGRVTIANRGGVTTEGRDAFGIFAQSVGGGGGLSGNAASAGMNLVEGQPRSRVAFGIGSTWTRQGGGGGSGAAVTVDSTGMVRTLGSGSIGIFAQSVGGGGGLVGVSDFSFSAVGTNLMMVGSTGAVGSAGAVTVRSTGGVYTTGIQSDGIFAQSAGGLKDKSGGSGNGGAVDVIVGGVVRAWGAGSSAIVGQSSHSYLVDVGTILASGGYINLDPDKVGASGDVRIAILEGADVSGSGERISANPAVIGDLGDSGAAIKVLDGKSNEVINWGRVHTANELAGLAIEARSRDVNTSISIRNYGEIAGQMDLGKLMNATVRNYSTGRLVSGSSLALGTNGSLVNGGSLFVQGDGTIGTTYVTGNYSQETTGKLHVDLKIGDVSTPGSSDRLEVSGTSAMAGFVQPRVIDEGKLPPGSYEFLMLSSKGSLTQDKLALVPGLSTAVEQYELAQVGNDLYLKLNVEFAPAALHTANEASMGQHIDAIQSAGGSKALEPFILQLEHAPLSALEAMYDHWLATSELQQLSGIQGDTRHFSDQLFSCIAPGGAFHVADEESCIWAREENRARYAGISDNGPGFHQSMNSLTFGIERGQGNGWHIGVGGGGQVSDHASPGYSLSRSRQGQLGLSVKHYAPTLNLSMAMAVGLGSLDSSRSVASDLVADGHAAFRFASLALRANRYWGKPGSWLKPELEVGGNLTSMAGYTEKGAGALSLMVDGKTYQKLHLRPSLEAGSEFSVGKLGVRPLVKLGVIHTLNGRRKILNEHFLGDPASVKPVIVRYDEAANVVELTAGAELLRGAWRARLAYTNESAGDFNGHQWLLKFSKAF